ncbi:hypothetical protein F5I97DRAFT_1870660 [Phlebopus sp. FC_14]|nr:hypothetical protein F5I97DRAFT_1870660 [Phlebopus sp. FC_14]
MNKLTAGVRLGRALRRTRCSTTARPSLILSHFAGHRISGSAYSTPAGGSSTSSSSPPKDGEFVDADSSSTSDNASLSTHNITHKIPISSIPQSAFPDLTRPDALLDSHDSLTFSPTKRAPFQNQVIMRNDPSMFEVYDDLPLPPHLHSRIIDADALSEADQEALMDELEKAGYGLGEGQEVDDMEEMVDGTEEIDELEGRVDMEGGDEMNPEAWPGNEVVDPDEIPKQTTRADFSHLLSKDRKLHLYTLLARRVTQQTGKGKIHRQYALVVVGNGDGLVGYGEGKDEDLSIAREKAVAVATRSLDYVERFENRTVWTETESKFGSTRIVLRPRPVGFGLRCNPQIHQVLKAAGFKDVSAKVWGSRNPMMVIKTLFRMLLPGNAPLGMGNGVGGAGSRLDKGSGLRRKEAVERDRGRKLVDLTMF